MPDYKTRVGLVTLENRVLALPNTTPFRRPSFASNVSVRNGSAFNLNDRVSGSFSVLHHANPYMEGYGQSSPLITTKNNFGGGLYAPGDIPEIREGANTILTRGTTDRLRVEDDVLDVRTTKRRVWYMAADKDDIGYGPTARLYHEFQPSVFEAPSCLVPNISGPYSFAFEVRPGSGMGALPTVYRATFLQLRVVPASEDYIGSDDMFSCQYFGSGLSTGRITFRGQVNSVRPWLSGNMVDTTFYTKNNVADNVWIGYYGEVSFDHRVGGQGRLALWERVGGVGAAYVQVLNLPVVQIGVNHLGLSAGSYFLPGFRTGVLFNEGKNSVAPPTGTLQVFRQSQSICWKGTPGPAIAFAALDE